MFRITWFALFGALLAGCGEDDKEIERVSPVVPTRMEALMQDPVAMDRGEALFVGSCAGLCHKQSPEDIDASFLFDCEWTHGGSDEEIFAVITSGIPDTRMVGFGENFPEGDDDKWKIIAYLRANQPPCE